MQTVEILAGGNFCNAVHQLNLRSAKCAYRYKPREGDCCENYQVWLMSMEDYKVIDAIDDEDWQDDWGWWRWSEGSNMGTAFVEYIVNGEKLKAWDGIHRTMFYSDVCEECSDRKNGLCNASNQDQLECYGERQYGDLLQYFWVEIGASTERNICALATDLAQQNNLTLSEFFKKYLGGEGE